MAGERKCHLLASGILLYIEKNFPLHDIQRLYKEGADKGQDQGKIFKMQSDSCDKTNG